MKYEICTACGGDGRKVVLNTGDGTGSQDEGISTILPCVICRGAGKVAPESADGWKMFSDAADAVAETQNTTAQERVDLVLSETQKIMDVMHPRKPICRKCDDTGRYRTIVFDTLDKLLNEGATPAIIPCPYCQ